MMLFMGGTVSKLFPPTVLPRNRFLFVLNLTHDTIGVQFSSEHKSEFTHRTTGARRLPNGGGGSKFSKYTGYTQY